MDTHTPPSRVIIDNWLLEIISRLFDPERESSFLHHVQLYQHRNNKLFSVEQMRVEEFHVLFQLLDLVVTHDEIIYDFTLAHGWNSDRLFKPVHSLLRAVHLKTLMREPTPYPYYAHIDNFTADVNAPLVHQRAIYYLELSRLLGVYYWPSPRRAEFLSQYSFSPIEGTFISVLKNYIDENLKKSLNEALPLPNFGESLNFPGFGASIILSCDSKEGLFATAMQFRETKECKAFRLWLKDMDVLLETGDIKAIARNFKELREVISMIRRELGLSEKHEQVELQIGLSPSLTLGTQAIESVINSIKPKPYHIIFLRKNLSHVLSESALYKAKQLFGSDKLRTL